MNPQNNGQPLMIQFGKELDLFLAKLVTKGVLFAVIVAYEGIWKFVRLFNQFTIGTIVAAIFYIIAGYIIHSG